ncbi:MAG: AraC family transcriptional regulator [Lentisphaeria bacterium]
MTKIGKKSTLISTAGAFRWPLRALPVIRTSGLFPMTVDDYRRLYRSPGTHALHVYLYPGEIRLGDRVWPLAPGTLTLTPAGTESAYRLLRDDRHWCVHFEPAEAGVAGPTVALPLCQSLGMLEPRVVERLRRITELHHRPTVLPEQREVLQARAAALFQELLLELASALPAGGATGPAGSGRLELALQELTERIEARLTQPLTVPALARAVRVSQNYLARRFRQRFGMTLPHYILARRVEMARHLLRNSSLPVGSVGQAVGLPDPHYFNKQFRLLAGVSPTAYRQAPEG